jgi:hypothetical protein
VTDLKVAPAVTMKKAGLWTHVRLSVAMTSGPRSLPSATSDSWRPWGFLLKVPHEAVVFEVFFIARLQMPPQPALTDILLKFRVQLHQLTPNAFTQFSKYFGYA